MSDIWAQIEEVFEGVDSAEIINVTALSTYDLVALYNEQDEILLGLGEVLHPTTQEGRDSHSLRAACRIELSNRGVL